MTELLVNLHGKFSLIWRKANRVILAFCWLAGLSCGILVGYDSGPSVLLLMRRVPWYSVSIVWLFIMTVLPFLFSAIAVFTSQFWLLLPISFAKAFLFSYISCGIMLAWRDIGWLIRLLLLFSECISIPLLYFFWLHIGSKENKCSFPLFFLFVSVFCLISSLDFCVISPVLARIIDF